MSKMTDDKQQPATKGDLDAIKSDIHGLKNEHARLVGWISENAYTRAEHKQFEEWLKENMVTKKDFDEAMTEIRASREERILLGQQLLRMDDRVVDHEKRITTLEV